MPIATFLTGTLSGIMLAGGDKDAQREALKAANKGWDKPPSPPSTPAPAGGMPPRPSMPTMSGMMSGVAGAATGFGMDLPPQMMTRMPELEPGDPTHRNFRND